MTMEKGITNERYVLRNARHLAADYMMRTIREGDVVVDATMGNGKDTLFLCELVGETGRVFAFDVQAEAVERTRERVKDAGFESRTTLLLSGHETMGEHIAQPVQAVMFNLGWLPGGNKAITTLRETTLPAIRDAISLMDRDAILNIAVYPGHKEGDAEGQMILDYLAGISRHRVCATLVKIVNSPTSPFFIVVETKP